MTSKRLVFDWQSPKYIYKLWAEGRQKVGDFQNTYTFLVWTRDGQKVCEIRFYVKKEADIVPPLICYLLYSQSFPILTPQVRWFIGPVSSS